MRKVRLAEAHAGHAKPFQMALHGQQAQFGFDATENEMRMLVSVRKQKACGFEARMASLNGSLRRGQIAANENVDIRDVRVLRRDLGETGFVHSISFRETGKITNSSLTRIGRSRQSGRRLDQFST
jgi:hypothetical protein